ncbi:flagellar hook-associated protein FlgK [Desulfovibrio ferrophilus]|uniref:Flagellar hook-associated protein 1 n=1 Tax=Desulfovibrio ferrophilus TaxID=241368 RepID=A0A2Z6AXC9_9BACT|nr:flagellar hook-associated protein FlgK [Desulfovibrio ferrophilus]BBD07907.1 flagellar hook-associated protein FlgK [Desulfovibrio ferrophilus]
MSGLTTLLDIGKGALFASQSSIEVTGNNIANVNTPGYARQAVRLEEAHSIDFNPGQLGTGVKAVEVFRYFNDFVEEQYIDKNAQQYRWDATYQNLRAVDSLFNESQVAGLNEALSKFWADWQELADNPALIAAREALSGNTQNLLSTLHTIQQDLHNQQDQVDEFIGQEVEEVNDILDQIADLNLQIQSHDVPGQNNANELKDKRALLVRELSEKIDIDYVDNGGGEFTVWTKAGQTLVDGTVTFSLGFENAQSMKALTSTSNFDGDIYFSGSDDFEYTFEVVSSGLVSNAGSAAQMRVSLDGGKTWLTDDDGNEMHVAARPEGGKTTVGDLTIWFGSTTDSSGTPAGDLEVGDKFTVVPKKSLYWYRTTSSKENITPQIYANGADNESRLTGGALAGYFQFRDQHVGRYLDKLDGFSKALIWEVNRLQSQGMGLQKFDTATGTYSVDSTTAALGSNGSGLAFFDKLQDGNMSLYFYDEASGELASGASFGPLDFGGGANFDASVHSMTDVVDAINNTWGTFMTADIVNNRVRMTANTGYEFGFGTDTAGLAAALGVNTFFEGDSAASMEMTTLVRSDPDFIASGHANGTGEINSGDNTTALSIAQLKDKVVTININSENPVNQTIGEYYNGLVAGVGADTATAEFNLNFNRTLAKDLNTRQQETAGVNLDEEMANLLKFQHSYTAASKLVKTADSMIQTLLGMKN